MQIIRSNFGTHTARKRTEMEEFFDLPLTPEDQTFRLTEREERPASCGEAGSVRSLAKAAAFSNLDQAPKPCDIHTFTMLL